MKSRFEKFCYIAIGVAMLMISLYWVTQISLFAGIGAIFLFVLAVIKVIFDIKMKKLRK